MSCRTSRSVVGAGIAWRIERRHLGRKGAELGKQPYISIDHGFFAGDATPMLVAKDRLSGMVFAMAVERKGAGHPQRQGGAAEPNVVGWRGPSSSNPRDQHLAGWRSMRQSINGQNESDWAQRPQTTTAEMELTVRRLSSSFGMATGSSTRVGPSGTSWWKVTAQWRGNWNER